MKDCSIIIFDFYNPRQILEVKTLEVVEKQDARRVIWCRDFNAHNTIWGGGNNNGLVMEDLMDQNGLICLNDGSGTRFNVNAGN